METSGARGTPGRKKLATGTPRKKVQRPQIGVNLEDDSFTVAKMLEKIKGLGNLCPTPESCIETAYVVKDRIEGRFCMEAIDSERLHSSRSSAGTPRSVQTFGLQRTRAGGGLAGHIFGLPSLDTDYFKDTTPIEQTGFGEKLERYIHRKTKTGRAVLTIPKSGIPNEIQPGDVEKQLQSLCRVDHPNIVSFREACEDQENLKLVYDWVDGGPVLCNLQSLLDVRESHLAEFVREVLSALAAANAFGVHHLDLCMSTIFVVSVGSLCPVKVFGLGLAGYLTALVSCKEVSKSNKHYYAAPEIFYTHNIKRLSPAARHASDVWSVGSMLFTLCCGRPPFGAGSIQELSGRVQRAMWSFGVEFAECSYVIKEAIEEMLKVPWRSRPSATACLRLSFLENCLAGSKDFKLSLLAVEQLHNFLRHDHCKQTVARMLTDTGLSRKAYEKLEKMFKELDINSDGSVSLAELRDAAASLGVSDERAAQMIKLLDRNGNGNLDISEFMAAVVMEQEALDEHAVKTVFTKIDRDADQRLTKQEMFTMLRQYSGSVEPPAVSKFIQQMDEDGDHLVNFQEFTSIFPAASAAEDEQEDRIHKFTASISVCEENFASFRASTEAWLRKLRAVEEKLLCACGHRERDPSKGNLSYEKGELSEYEVHLMLTTAATVLEQAPGKPKSTAQAQPKKKGQEETGTKIMGVAILGASHEARGSKARDAGKGTSGTENNPGPHGHREALEVFTKAVHTYQLETKDAADQSTLAMSLHLLIKVKSESSWQQPLQDALFAMRQSCTSNYAEVVLRSRADFSRCYNNISDEYTLREAMMLPKEDHRTLGVPQGAQLLPVHTLKGANLNSTSSLRGLQDKGLPVKLVFRWDREGRPEEQRQVHLSKLAWAGRYVKAIETDVQALLEEVDEDMQAFSTTEGRVPGLPSGSLPYLKHCEGRGLPSGVTNTEDEIMDLDASTVETQVPGLAHSEELTSSHGSTGSNLGEEAAAAVDKGSRSRGKKRIERTQVLADQVRRQRLAEGR